MTLTKCLFTILSMPWRCIRQALPRLFRTVGARSVDLDQRRDGPRVTKTGDTLGSYHEKRVGLDEFIASPRAQRDTELFGSLEVWKSGSLERQKAQANGIYVEKHLRVMSVSFATYTSLQNFICLDVISHFPS